MNVLHLVTCIDVVCCYLFLTPFGGVVVKHLSSGELADNFLNKIRCILPAPLEYLFLQEGDG